MAGAPPNHSQLLHLTAQLSQLSNHLHAHLQLTSQQEPDFKLDTPEVVSSPQYEEIRASLNETANDLLLLVNGPKVTFRNRLAQHYDLAAYQIALEFGLFDLIPVGDSRNVSQIAEAAGLDEDRTGRVLRLLATQRVFHECQQDVFEHTAASSLIAQDLIIKDTFHMQLDEIFSATSDAAKCLREAPRDPSGFNSPFHYRFGMPIWEYYKQNREKGIRFGHAMEGSAKLDRKVTQLRDEFDWSLLQDGIVVDVGGGNGSTSVSLARTFPGLHFVVQDNSRELLAQGENQISEDADLKERIKFTHYSFFDPQPQRGAAAFFVRQCFHNWNDDDSVKILGNFVPALEECRPGTPLLINETIMPKPGEKTRWEEHTLRQVDISMLVILGARQRTEADFEKLLKQADSRFRIAKVHGVGSMGLLEVHLGTEGTGLPQS